MTLSVLTLLLGLAFLYQLVALYETWRFTADRGTWAPAPEPGPPVTLLKPLPAWTPEVREDLATFCIQRYPRYQVLVGIRAEEAPAVRAELPCAAQPGWEVRVIPCGEEVRAANPKIRQVLQMVPAARHPILVLADADMRVGPDYLARVVAPLRRPEVGLVTCYHVAREAPTLPAALEAMLINTEYLPAILVGRRLQGMGFGFGATLALRREVLEAIGGFEAVADVLADDNQLAVRTLRQGYRVVLSDYLPESRLPPMDWAGLLEHQLRWARTHRACQPAGWFFSLLTHLTLWSLLWWWADGLSSTGGRLVAWTLLFRMGQATLYNLWVDGLRPRWLPALLAPLRDGLYLLLWAWSHLTDRVVWAGQGYRVHPDGTLEPLPEEALAKRSYDRRGGAGA